MNTTPQPTTEDRFQFAETIGFGGMATVYRAFDTRTQRDVAIKVLHPHLRENPVITQHFRQEYKIAQILEHPNIVPIHTLIETPSMLALVMELHDAHDLKAHLQHHGQMHHHQVLLIANQILDALQAAHALNIIHHDIKPHNILWNPNTKTAKLIDFGLAQLDPSLALATPESAIATVEYSAPEQFDDLGSDHRADLYSLAITLFELLSNTLPYRANTAASIIQMHQNAPIADVRVFARNTPAPFAETLLRALAKAPEDRFQTARDMRKALTKKSLSPRTLPAQSSEWDDLITYHRTRIATARTQLQTPQQNNWNLYLPPLHCKTIDKTNHQQQTQFIQSFVHLFQKYPDNYHGDLNLSAHGPLAGFIVQKHSDSIETIYPTFFSKNQHPLPFSTHLNTWDSVPLASGLTHEQAERIRYDLGNEGIIAKTFHFDLHQPNTSKSALRNRINRCFADILARTHQPFPEVAAWHRLHNWRHLPTYFNTFTLLLLCYLTFKTITIVDTHTATAILFIWLLIFARICISYTLHKFAPTEGFPQPKLFDPNAYHLQFKTQSTNTHASLTPKPTFLQDIHATTYLQLRSPRIQNTFERIILTLLELSQTNPENTQTQTQNILTQTTTIATRITHLQQQLHHHNYPALYEQLTRIDTHIARSTDTHHTAELIQQKSTIRTQLDQIDTHRHELKTLAQQLSTIAQQLKT